MGDKSFKTRQDSFSCDHPVGNSDLLKKKKKKLRFLAAVFEKYKNTRIVNYT